MRKTFIPTAILRNPCSLLNCRPACLPRRTVYAVIAHTGSATLGHRQPIPLVLTVGASNCTLGEKMNKNYVAACGLAGVLIAVAAHVAIAQQDKYTVAVPGGLGFAEFRGYEDWQSVSVSKTGHSFAIILANSVMIDAYRAGAPGNGKPFPDGSKIAKIHYKPAKSADAPDPTTEVPGVRYNVDFIERDSKRFLDPDAGGWGYASFDYDDKTDTFVPSDESSTPPQGRDTNCGVACHTLAAAKDHIFTEYPKH